MSSPVVKPSGSRNGTKSAAPGVPQAALLGPSSTSASWRHRQWRRDRFLELYGWTGLLMIAMFLLSAVWMAMLAVIQQAPTWVANVLMDTADLDEGDLWIFTRADDSIAWCSTLFLGGVAFSYVWLISVMMRQSCFAVPRGKEARVLSTQVMPLAGASPDSAVLTALVSRPSTTSKRDWEHIRGRLQAYLVQARLHDSPLLSLPKLVLQTVTLFAMLADGIPPTITLTYASLLFINWMISFYHHPGQRDDSQLVKSRIFFSFDMFFAVFAPLHVLVYACANFKFDRAEFATRVETLFPGNFERIARLYVDPTQISLFRIAFQSLQLATWPSLLIKIVLNIFTVLRWHRIVVDLSNQTTPEPIGYSHSRIGRNFLRGLVFLVTGSAIFVYTIIAIVSTGDACRAYQSCTVPSYQWSVGSSTCACTVFVDRHTNVSTFAEWQNPEDVSENLAKLAAAGRLKVIQIINRKLPTLPDELRGCHELEHLILFYTLTATIPDWTSGFTKLKYLHIEGDPTRETITHLPTDLFAHMPFLTLIHLGDLGKLTAIPDLRRLVRLKYLVLAILRSVPQVPGLDALTNLEQLMILSGDRLELLPSLSKLPKLTTVVLLGLGPMCCNGFLTGICNSSDPACIHHSACSSTVISQEDQSRFGAAFATGCQFPTIDSLRPTIASTDLACGGKQFKQCTINGFPGICHSVRMQVVWCDPDPSVVAMRRLQIQRGVGEPCDPAVEEWLGCTGK